MRRFREVETRFESCERFPNQPSRFANCPLGKAAENFVPAHPPEYYDRPIRLTANAR